jgi:hypothetical protein
MAKGDSEPVFRALAGQAAILSPTTVVPLNGWRVRPAWNRLARRQQKGQIIACKAKLRTP